MAAQMLRRWNSFYGAFDPVDAAIEAADPDQFSRHVFQRARGDLLVGLYNAADDNQAERICRILDDLMAESLEKLRVVPSTPERVRLLARGIVSGWETSVQDDDAEVTPAMPMKKKVENVPQPKATISQHHQERVSADPDAKTKRPPKIVGEPLSKKTAEVVKKVSDPAADFVHW
ncbi:hypothetical protein VPH35_125116 [Triticum aestivum]